MDNWKQIRLELAGTAEFPSGSVARAYLLRLPLADDDHVDRTAFRQDPRRAVVRRHWSAEPDQCGRLFEAGEDWIIRCEGKPESRLELDGKPLRLGQQIPLKLSEGTVLPMRISSIR
jgi:hypothetical protein